MHGIDLDIAAPRIRRAGRAVRLRQVDDAAHDRRARGHLRRRGPDRRARGQRPAAALAQHLDGVPELRALPAHDRAREPGLLAEDRRASPGRDREARGRGGGDPRARRRFWTAPRPSFRAASASASPWAAPSCATRTSSCSTSRCRTSTPSCAARCAPRSRSCTRRCSTTVIYVTHDQVEAMTLADRIVIMRDGHIEQVGTPDEVFEHPATPSSPASSARRR